MKTELECGVSGSMTAVLGRSVELHLVRSARGAYQTQCASGLMLDSSYPSKRRTVSAGWDTLR